MVTEQIPHRLTLVAKQQGGLSERSFVVVSKALENSGIQILNPEPVWLSDGKAASIQLDQKPAHDFFEQQWSILKKSKTDIFIIPRDQPTIRVAFFDMDKTVVDNETLDDVAKNLGLLQEFQAITQAGMGGKILFDQSFVTRVEMLAGHPADRAMKKALEETKIYPGVRALVKFLHDKNKTYCGLTSGGVTYFTDHVQAEVGFDVSYGGEVEINKQGRFTGKVITINGPEQKRDQFLSAIRDYADGDSSRALAMGDGNNDSKMLAQAGLAFGHRPKKALANILENVIWHTDHISVLYALGHNDQEIAPYLEEELNRQAFSVPVVQQG